MLQPEFAYGFETEGFFIAGIDGNGVVGGFNTLLILLLLIGYIGHKEPRIQIIRVGIQHLFGQFSSMVTAPHCTKISPWSNCAREYSGASSGMRRRYFRA